jgi:hypothetical protein
MDKEKAQEILVAFGRPQFKTENGVISFSRQTEKDLEEIENKSNEELVEHWKSLVYINEIYGQVSLNEMQRISLIELEFDERKNINTIELKNWFEEQVKKFDEQDFLN